MIRAPFPGAMGLNAILCALALALGGCGQKGPLTLPQPAPAKAAEPGEAKQPTESKAAEPK